MTEQVEKKWNYKWLFRIMTIMLVITITLLMFQIKENNASVETKVGLKAIAVLTSLKESKVEGQVIFEQMDGKVKVTARISGLNPNQKHGFHVHNFGDLSAENGKSAGPHYNPEGNPHGLPPSNMRHAGAFGNLVADANGNVIFSFEDQTISLTGNKNPVMGRAVVVHAKEDTGAQPSGNAGPRIAFGVIGYKQVK